MWRVMGRRVLVPPPTCRARGGVFVLDGVQVVQRMRGCLADGRLTAAECPCSASMQSQSMQSPGPSSPQLQHAVQGNATHVVELEPHQRLDQRRLAVGLVADHQNGGGVKGLFKVLRQRVELAVGLVQALVVAAVGGGHEKGATVQAGVDTICGSSRLRSADAQQRQLGGAAAAAGAATATAAEVAQRRSQLVPLPLFDPPAVMN